MAIGKLCATPMEPGLNLELVLKVCFHLQKNEVLFGAYSNRP